MVYTLDIKLVYAGKANERVDFNYCGYVIGLPLKIEILLCCVNFKCKMLVTLAGIPGVEVSFHGKAGTTGRVI